MKNKFNIVLFLFTLIGFSSCEINDPVNDWAEVGQRTPYVYWELGSTTVSAGSNVSFTAYYYADGKDISSIEVWYDVNKVEAREVTCPLISYTFKIDADEQMRSAQKIKEYDLNTVAWDQEKRSYIMTTTFPVSPVLVSDSWSDVKPADFTEEKFVKLYTDTFETAFRKGLQTEIEKDYYAKMRKLVAGFSLMENIEDYDALFTQEKDPETGKINYIIADKDKAKLDADLANVAFVDLIYNSQTESYTINYSSNFYLNAEFRAYDSAGVIGRTDNKVITVN